MKRHRCDGMLAGINCNTTETVHSTIIVELAFGERDIVVTTSLSSVYVLVHACVRKSVRICPCHNVHSCMNFQNDLAQLFSQRKRSVI